MHEIEPYYHWEKYYKASQDARAPFYGKQYEASYSSSIYNYVIHPLWDFFGSETLYMKLQYCNYEKEVAIIELLGEWNDAINNDIMHLKRNVIDALTKEGIKHFILIGDNVFNVHHSDDCYYEEWFEDVEDGWIVAINFRDHILDEWQEIHLDHYILYGGHFNIENWRTFTPMKLFDGISILMSRLIG